MKKRQLIGYSVAVFEGPYMVTMDHWSIYKKTDAEKLAKEANKTIRKNYPKTTGIKYKAVKTM